MDTIQPTPPIKFEKSFTPEVETYINLCKEKNETPTVKGFATHIGTDEESIWGWANKKKKDESGNITDELARPLFYTAIKQLEAISTVKEEVKIETPQPIPTPSKPQEEKLNAKQELFAQLYATDKEFFGNGVQTYIEVYEPDQHKPNWYKSACASASQLLSNIKVCNRINELLEDGGLNDVNVDKQLQFLINQFDDKSTKLAAIREYNKLKQRITEKIDHTTLGKALPTPIYGGKSAE